MNCEYPMHQDCAKCNKRETVFLSKREATFELYNTDELFPKICPMCKGNNFTFSTSLPKLDMALLTEWACNEDLHLMPQDEELLLADEYYFDLILEILDTQNDIHIHKQNTLMDALCILVYDNSIEKNDNADIFLKKKGIEELNKRKAKLMVAEDWIMDYIKEIVFPLLDLPNS